MPSLYYIQCLKYQKTAKYCAMESEYAMIIEGMIYRARLKGNLHERKAGQSHFFLKKTSRNIPKEQLEWMKRKTNLMEQEKETPPHNTWLMSSV